LGSFENYLGLCIGGFVKSAFFILGVFLLLGFQLTGKAQKYPDLVVANFSTGSYGSRDYESLSFWVYQNKNRKIDYSYRDKKGEILSLELSYLGKFKQGSKSGFRVLFPNNLVLRVFLAGDVLEVKAEKGNYFKYFRWQYEGPVDGRGTFCEPCTQDASDAIRLLQDFYF
jgi:hypothetical protein